MTTAGCVWCGRFHGEGEAMECERKLSGSNKRNGCIMAAFMMPFAFLGFLAGILYGAAKAGFREGSGSWKTAWDFIEKKRPS
jgi:hypothetical protein